MIGALHFAFCIRYDTFYVPRRANPIVVDGSKLGGMIRSISLDIISIVGIFGRNI